LFEVPMPLLAEARALNFFGSIESYARYRDLLDTRGDDVDFRVAKRMRLGATFSEQDITQLHQTRQQWIGQMDVALAGFDAMLMPTVPMVAPAIAPLEASEDLFWATNLALLRNPSIVNLLDGCAVSLPCHAPGTLPVGLMVAGSAMTDARVMAVALAIEAALKTRTEAR
jgi:Asp-tRNA(Asn)/Glu-tRNA(Gln) amidotransferase A subunit family amidase